MPSSHQARDFSNDLEFIYEEFVLENSFSKIGNCKIVENLPPEKIIRDLLKSHHFLKFGKKSSGKNKICHIHYVSVSNFYYEK